MRRVGVLEGAATKAAQYQSRIAASRDELLRLRVDITPTDAPRELTKRSALALRLDYAAATRATELRAAGLHLAEAALTAATAVRKLLDGSIPASWQARREARLYVRKLRKLAALCERTSREAEETARAVTPIRCSPKAGKHAARGSGD